MQYKTPYDFSKNEFFTASGSMTRPVYKAVLEKDGQISLKEDGIEMTYEKIQSFKDSVDINVIVNRFASGDLTALEQRSGSYGDFIEVPSSYMEILNSIVDARNAYEINKPGISFEEYINKALSAAYEASMPIVDVKESEEIEPKSE